MTSPAYQAVLLPVLEQVLDLYGGVMGQSAAVDALFRSLLRRLVVEEKVQASLQSTLGSLDALFAASHASGR